MQPKRVSMSNFNIFGKIKTLATLLVLSLCVTQSAITSAQAQMLQTDTTPQQNSSEIKELELEMPYTLPTNNGNNTPDMQTPPKQAQPSENMPNSLPQNPEKKAPTNNTAKKPPEGVVIQGTIQEKHGTALRIERVQFYHKIDEEVNYLSLKKDWLTSHPTSLNLAQAGKLAEDAFEKSTVETPLEEWRYHGGPNPFVFTAKAHIYNDSPEAHLNKKFKIIVKAKIGNLGVNPNTLLVDYNHLKNSATWKTLSNQSITVPAIAPGEELLLDVMQLNMLAFMATYPNQWPTELTVSVSMTGSNAFAEESLHLTPDHFMVEGLIP